MATDEGRERMEALGDWYRDILEYEENERNRLYAEITKLLKSGHANGAEIARSLGVHRQRIYQIKAQIEEQEKAQ